MLFLRVMSFAFIELFKMRRAAFAVKFSNPRCDRSLFVVPKQRCAQRVCNQ